ncbi:MAG: glycosyltransferase [Acidimicrobiales bacterium]|nr:glycosyltransferase [Acidimicrobiales bacterium]
MVGPRESHVTVLLSTFDGARWLPDLLESVRNQTHADWTLLARDDGSTDDTMAILEAAAAADPRIQVVTDRAGNLGPTASFLSLLAQVNDGFFAFCDQDDIWHPHKLDTSIGALAIDDPGEAPGDPIAAVYTDARVVDGAGELLHASALAQRGTPDEIPYGRLLINNVAIGATVVGTAGLAKRAIALADGVDVLWHDWWIALVAGHDGKLTGCPQATMDWRRHGETVTGATPAGVAERARRRRRYLAFSVAAAKRLAAEPAGANPDAHTAAIELARLDPSHPTARGLLRAWRRAGVRAWPLRGQIGLLSSVVMGRTDQ